MDNIKNVVQDVLKKMSPKKENPSEKIEDVFGEFLSSEEKKHTNIVGIKESIVFINVDTPAWGYQLKIKKEKILKKIQKINPDIKDVRFNVGKI